MEDKTRESRLPLRANFLFLHFCFLLTMTGTKRKLRSSTNLLQDSSNVTASLSISAPAIDYPAPKRRKSAEVMVWGQPWFPDGSVALVAEDGTHFRVHQGVLAAHSGIFNTLLDNLDALRAQEEVEGVPVLRVDDSPQNVEYMLRELYFLRCVSIFC